MTTPACTMAPERGEGVVEALIRVMKSSALSQAVRACLLTTRDRDHALSLLKTAAAECGAPLHHFTVAGRRRYDREQLRWESMGGESDPVALLREAQDLKDGGVVVIEDCLALLRDEGGDPRIRMALAQLTSSETVREGLTLVFMEPPELERYLPSILADQFVRLDVGYPRLSELERIAREQIARIARRAGIDVPVETIREQSPRLGSGLAGLTRSAARDALRDALAPNPADLASAFERLSERKAAHLSRGLAMNVLDAVDGEAPIGLDYLVEYLRTTRSRIGVHGKDRAKGIILIGPPGTGKTMLARMIGHLVDLPVVEFRIAALMNSLLGETERRFAQAFQTLEAMAPNVVFVDEIEKAFGDSSERDGGTMMRCTGALLSWLSDNPHPNFIVATSNSLRRMGEVGLTMTRSERFDRAFFVDVPNRASRRHMLERWLDGAMDGHEEASRDLADATERFSGADLRSVVKQAVVLARYGGHPLTKGILREQVDRKRPRALALYDEFQELRRWARMFCDPAGPIDQ